MIKNKVEKLIKKILPSEFKDFKIKIEYPPKSEYGDYTLSLPIEIAAKTSQNSIEVANVILARIEKENQKTHLFKKIEIKKPGFINFFLSDEILIEELKRVLKEKEHYGAIENKDKTMVIDYSSPNIAKPFGIGHLRSTIIGQAIYNIYKFQGWRCIGDNHLGDWGTQFGKLIVAIKKWSDKKSLDHLSVYDLEKLYVRFHQEAEKDPCLESEAKKWFKKLEEGDKEAKKIWETCINISQKEFEDIYQLLEINFDYTLGESFYQPMVKEIVEELIKKELAFKSEGALIVDFPQDQGLPPAVILKSDGAATYFTRDLAAIKYRLKRWKPDLMIYETGSDQTLHFKQLFKIVEMLGWNDLSDKKEVRFFHIAHGLIRFKEGKFSTRKGQTIHLRKVLEEAIKRAEEVIEKSGTSKNLSVDEKKKISKIVGIGAVKYNDLSQHYSKDIIFDWNKILNIKGNSAPYLQYTYARCQSVLKKSQFKIDLNKIKIIDFKPEEEAILRTIYHFPEIISESAEKFSPNLICNFVFDLAQKYNLFYGFYPIIGAENQDIKTFRIVLTAVVSQLLKNALSLLGISMPEKM